MRRATPFLATSTVAMLQEPDVRMPTPKISSPLALVRLDTEPFAMTGDPSDQGRDHKHPAVSVFRRGAAGGGIAKGMSGPQGQGPFPNLASLAALNPARVWESLNPVVLDADALAGNGLFANPAANPAASAFDILRTRLVQAMEQRGWKRIAITSPTHGCGKSFVAANLALALARRPSSRTVLMDLELRRPALADLLGQKDVGAIRDFLTGEQPLEAMFRRVGRSLALGLNAEAVPASADLLQDPATASTLIDMLDQLAPDIAIYDLPPALASDDVLAMLPQVDAVLLVADGTRTTATDIKACERLFEDRIPLMGVVLNRAQDRDLGRYAYDKR